MQTAPNKATDLPASPCPPGSEDWGQALRILLIAALCLYVGVAVSGLPYLVLVTEKWIESVAAQCSSRPDLCVEVSSEVRRVRGWWRGRVFFFVAQPGKSSELKSLFRESCPTDFLDQIQSPCYYAGISVVEQ